MKKSLSLRPAVIAGVLWILGDGAGAASSLYAQAGAPLDANAIHARRAEARGSLSPGDAIRLVFWREPELNGEFPVDENGEAVLPILGSVSATEVSAAILRDRLTAAYDRQLRNQQVQITLLRRARVLGAVSEPGLYFVDPTMTLGDAIALAGGASDRGKLDGIRVLRGEELIRDDLGPDELFDEELFSGDRIHVPQRSWVSRHSGVLIGGVISATAIVLTRVLIP